MYVPASSLPPPANYGHPAANFGSPSTPASYGYSRANFSSPSTSVGPPSTTTILPSADSRDSWDSASLMQHIPSPTSHLPRPQLASGDSPSYHMIVEEPHEEDVTELEKLALSWEKAHVAYYEAMDFKEKSNKLENTSSASSIFWAAFEGFCEEVENNLDGDQELLQICMDLMERKKLKRGISISESNLSKLVQDRSISMYNEIDFKIKFELCARQF